MESVTNSKCQKISNFDILVNKVVEKLKGRKYLLVLDDLWNEDSIKWNMLKSFLDVGAVGSKVIVTTRNQKVASVVQGFIPPYNLNILSELECWSIIKEKAFSPGGASQTQTMKSIGEGIAKKCGGLPLAAIFFGCLMYSKSDKNDWLSIRDNKSLETLENQSGGIIPILKLSYDNLSPHLKQCFSYCSLFPKDWVFNRETLIRLWMAEGFLHPSNGGYRYSLEDIGNDYFNNLLSCSFFQDVRSNSLGDITTFKMHDLVHDLAQSVVGSHEITSLKASELENDVSDIRRVHLVFDEERPDMFSNVLENAKNLRTIFCRDRKILEVLSNKRLRIIHLHGVNVLDPDILFVNLKFKHLRYLYLTDSTVHIASISQLYNLHTLNLNRCQNVQMIIADMGSWKNISHLCLAHSDLKVLPDSICKLTNLQTLDITSCDISVLPINIGSLRRLYSLVISFTKITELPDSVTGMHHLRRLDFDGCKLRALPSNLGVLTQLRSLDLSFTNLTELPESFTSNLCDLEYVNLGECCGFPKDIKNWVKLRSLTLRSRTAKNIMNYLEGINEVMPTGIETLTSLEVLLPYVVRKEEVASGTNGTSGIQELADLNSLKVLAVTHVNNVRDKMDAERAKLIDKINLQSLKLYWKPKEEANNSNMVLESLQPHPNLKELEINNFPGSEFPKWMGSSSCLENLVELKFKACKGCKRIPALGMLPCLRVLYIYGMPNVKCLGKGFYYQEDEEESSSAKVTTQAKTLFASLIKLDILDFSKLEAWAVSPVFYNSFPVLEFLTIGGCPELTSVPDFRLWTSLRELRIFCCNKLKEAIPYDL